MSETIEIRAYQKDDFEQVVDISYQLFHTIVGPFTKMDYDLGKEFIKDADIINNSSNIGLYVILVNDEIAGVMKLDSKEFPKRKLKPIRLCDRYKKYGFLTTIVSSIVFGALSVKLDPKELYVDFLCVDSKHRGLGLGTKLLQYGLEEAKKTNMDKYTLAVLDSNPGAKKLYERFGFKIVKENKFPRFVEKRLGASKDIKMEIKLK